MRRRVVVLVSIVLIASAAAWIALASPLLDSPERHVARYLDATSSGDTTRALDEWSVYEGAGRIPADPIATRRLDLTQELATNRVGRRYAITSVDYWRTCCEPGRIEGARNAGLARVHVSTAGEDGKPYRLLF